MVGTLRRGDQRLVPSGCTSSRADPPRLVVGASRSSPLGGRDGLLAAGVDFASVGGAGVACSGLFWADGFLGALAFAEVAFSEPVLLEGLLSGVSLSEEVSSAPRDEGFSSGSLVET